MLPEAITNAVISVVEDGGNVAIYARQPREVIEQLQSKADSISKVRLSNGNEAAHFANGASVVIRRTADRLRGVSADLLVVPIGLSHDERNTLWPCLATSKNGQWLGYM